MKVHHRAARAYHHRAAQSNLPQVASHQSQVVFLQAGLVSSALIAFYPSLHTLKWVLLALCSRASQKKTIISWTNCVMFRKAPTQRFKFWRATTPKSAQYSHTSSSITEGMSENVQSRFFRSYPRVPKLTENRSFTEFELHQKSFAIWENSNFNRFLR